MSSSVLFPMMQQDRDIRLQCLELAIKTPNAGTAGIVVIARQYADFVLGTDPDAMAPLGNRNYLGTGEFSQMSAKLYGGSASGTVTLSWLKGYKLSGNLDVKQVELQKIASMLSSKTHISGKLNAEPVFSASADSADQLMDTLHLETLFKVQNGVLYGVDIQKAAASLIKKGSTGGETRFDQLSAHLVMAHNGYRFTQLKIASGTFAVDGSVNISAKKDLSGRINAQVAAFGISTKVPLNIKGTVDSPLLYPTGATIAGAAIGTAIMGPGVGTSVGAKVGGWVDNIFGKKENKSPK